MRCQVSKCDGSLVKFFTRHEYMIVRLMKENAPNTLEELLGLSQSVDDLIFISKLAQEYHCANVQQMALQHAMDRSVYFKEAWLSFQTCFKSELFSDEWEEKMFGRCFSLAQNTFDYLQLANVERKHPYYHYCSIKALEEAENRAVSAEDFLALADYYYRNSLEYDLALRMYKQALEKGMREETENLDR